MGGGFTVQPAAATHNCGELESTAVFVTGPVGDFLDQTFNNADCTSNHKSQAIEAINEADGNQTELDIYNAALQQKAEAETRTAVYDNFLSDTESAAWMRAEIAIAEAYENGSSESVAKSKARQAISEYYAVKQKNLIEEWNISITSAITLRERAMNESEVDNRLLYQYSSMKGYNHHGTFPINSDPTEVIQMSLVNGSDHPAVGLRVDDGNGYAGTKGPSFTGNDMHTALVVTAPNDNYDRVHYLDYQDFGDRWSAIQSQNDNLQDEVDPFVNNTWDAYESGQINSSDVLSRNTQMFRYGAEASNGSDLYTTVAALSQMGLDTPELNGTGTMTVTHDNVEYHGLVMAREAPNGTWEANTTYDGSNIDGPVFLATTDGRQIDLDGEFRISSISSTDGSSIDNVTATEVVYKTSNTSEQLEKMQRISELRKEVEAKQQSAGGGSGSPIDPKYLLGVLAIIGVLAYAQGQKRGD